MRPLRTMTLLGATALLGCADPDPAAADTDTDLWLDPVTRDTDPLPVDTDSPDDSDPGEDSDPPLDSDSDSDGGGGGDSGFDWPNPDTSACGEFPGWDTGSDWQAWCACAYEACLDQGEPNCDYLCNG